MQVSHLIVSYNLRGPTTKLYLRKRKFSSRGGGGGGKAFRISDKFVLIFHFFYFLINMGKHGNYHKLSFTGFQT